ncbi:MAG: hypothetical protein IT370_31295 [Deltaproteobacteria bacterium]|nr:hypothetical protein [Deltaproteobacteria bacterium]
MAKKASWSASRPSDMSHGRDAISAVAVTKRTVWPVSMAARGRERGRSTGTSDVLGVEVEAAGLYGAIGALRMRSDVVTRHRPTGARRRSRASVVETALVASDDVGAVEDDDLAVADQHPNARTKRCGMLSRTVSTST